MMPYSASLPPDLATSSATATATMDPPQTTATSYKLRLMCSYGGQIFPRPNSMSLIYVGGDTRIITIPATTTAAATGDLTLSSLTAHVAAALHINTPFTLKYQLPNHDLDSLISLSTDEDFLIMLDEHQRSSSPIASRIRLFLFPAKPTSELTQLSKPSSNLAELKHPKTETWFVDALKSAKIMQKGDVGFGGEGQCEGNIGNYGGGGGEASSGLCGVESMVLETTSSFGSTSSSVSLSNLPVKGHTEDNGTGLQDNKVKLSAPDSIISDNSVATTVCYPSGGTNQDTLCPVENKVSLNLFESESKLSEPSTGVEMHKSAAHVSGFPLSLQFEQPQKLQFIHSGAPQYIAENPTGIMPPSPYYLVNSPVAQQQLYYQTNQQQPMYLVPVGRPHNLPMQRGLMNTATIASTCPPVHPISSLNPAQMAYKIAAVSPVPELASQVYRTVPMASPIVNVRHCDNLQLSGGLPQISQQIQTVDVASTEPASYGNELEGDSARAQIYKSQPPAPTFPSQFQTVTKATTILLSEAMAQLHTDNVKQQLRTSQPQ